MLGRRPITTGAVRLAIVHNNVDERTSIGKLASWAVRTALDADMEVTVVARDLDKPLRSVVEWRRLYVPPRVHAVQWAVARKTIRWAMRGCAVDLVHVYQPQVAALADTWHVEFLSRVAVETTPKASNPSVGQQIRRAQARAVARLEDHYLRRLGDFPTVLFCSESMARHFARLYGRPTHSAVLHNPAPPPVPARTSEARRSARLHLGLPQEALVVGFLGGVDDRKGYTTARSAVADISDALLLMAGPRSERHVDADLGPRLHALGMQSDLSEFWASIDVLAVPSRFDPFAMVVTEAAAHGIPSVVTPGVGAADQLLLAGAGVVREPAEFAGGVQTVMARRSEFTDGARALASALASSRQSELLLEHWRARLQ